MSFVTKVCSSIIQNGFYSLSLNAVTKSATNVRNFHMMMKPLPKSITEVNWTQGSAANNVVSPTSLTSGLQRLLAPVSSVYNQIAGFKVKGSLKRRCKDCYFVKRQQRMYVICPTHPRHKQMAMKKRDYKSWILTHATQSKVRPY